MKVQVEFITVRLNGKLLFVEAISDHYAEVQIIIPKEDLDERTLEVLSANLIVTEFEDSFFIVCNEAKDSCDTYCDMVIAIESKTIDFE